MKNARLLFALIFVGAAACSAAEATGPLPGPPRSSSYMGGANDPLPDSTTTKTGSTKQGG